MKDKKQPNRLARETSLYLRQHSLNPVDWHPWGEEALEKAASENKLLLISIGYSSCHWCHVMERESFENEAIAVAMNDNFICIKVDREERPDIDNIYMTAVQLISGSGGWPLNCVALPDGRPVWGGTYFRPDKWMEILTGIARYYRTNKAETEKYADDLSRGIADSILVPHPSGGRYTISDLKPSVIKMKDDFDPVNGGTRGAPKFPMPVSLEFLMHYGYATGDQKIPEHIEFTLQKMAAGGIYDQAGGGFARYSVDEEWRVPHFEKMLYDNAQLTGLYSDAFMLFRNDRFRDVVSQTADFLTREMLTEDGLFAASIDADSEGEEGRFYVWTPPEIEGIAVIEKELFNAYYGLVGSRLWEGKYHILTAPADESEFCRRLGIECSYLEEMKARWRSTLLEARGTRERPVTDQKAITSWNALAVTGLTRAWRATGDDHLLSLAVKVAEKLNELQYPNDGPLMRIYSEGKSSVKGFLDDYAFMAEAMLSLYEVTMSDKWLRIAVRLVDETTDKFYDKEGNMFLYKAKGEEVLITNHFETYDNVIPSSNSIMAQTLFRLGNLTSDSGKIDLALAMLGSIADRVVKYPAGYSGWARLMLWKSFPFHQVAIVGTGASLRLREVMANYMPAAVVASSSTPSEMPLFEGRYSEDKTLIYPCIDNSCMLPVESAGELLKLVSSAQGQSTAL
ncbi:MAG: thioredoxin domain-containing protein [Bacteroidales bacterium]